MQKRKRNPARTQISLYSILRIPKTKFQFNYFVLEMAVIIYFPSSGTRNQLDRTRHYGFRFVSTPLKL